MPYRNLVKGQWQIGEMVFGRGTNIIVKTADVAAADVQPGDYQTARSDSKNFGFDQLVPTTIQFEMSFLNNYILPGWESIAPNFWHSMPVIEDFAAEWSGDDVRNTWGAMKPLYHRSRHDNIEKIIYGRPSAFAPVWNDEYANGEVIGINAEFRRGDTFAYGVLEKSIILTNAQKTQIINGHAGRAPTWLRAVITGPVVNPSLTLTNLWNQGAPVVINMTYTIPAGQSVEISGYPWSRRVVSSTGLSLPRNLTGASPYLDKLRFNFSANVSATLGGSGMSGATKAQIFYRDAYRVI